MKRALAIALLPLAASCGQEKGPEFYLSCDTRETIYAPDGEIEQQPRELLVYKINTDEHAIYRVDGKSEEELCTHDCDGKDFTDTEISFRTSMDSPLGPTITSTTFDRTSGEFTRENLMLSALGSRPGRIISKGTCKRHSTRPEIERVF